MELRNLAQGLELSGSGCCLHQLKDFGLLLVLMVLLLLAFVGQKRTDHLVQKVQRNLAHGLKQTGSGYCLLLEE